MNKDKKDILDSYINKPIDTIEQELLDRWDRLDILRKSIDSKDKDKIYAFYDGPITANGKPHYGHVLTMVLKDVVPRYWTMRGYRVTRSLGWDCQGIPVEYEVEKNLKFEKKEDIESFGIAKFNQLCRESVQTYSKNIKELTRRMGRILNSDEEYATMDPQYIESMWWSLKELYNKGLLYEGYKVVPYSTRAGTSLSNHEVALGGYADIEDLAITVKLYVPSIDTYLLAWTTTPWTIPGNLLVAVGRDYDYVIVESEGSKYIVAKNLVERNFAETKYRVVKELKGSELIDLEYEPIFDYYLDRKDSGAFRVVHADHVLTEDGTGLVHQAPYGEEDFNLMTDMGIEMFDYLDSTGNFKEPIHKYKGMFYKEANPHIVQDIEAKNGLFNKSSIVHKMPICWRTNTPLIYKPIRSWYIAVTKIKEKLIEENNKINWIPDHIKVGRFGNWLENAKDWALSRNRYWGTPLPVWKDDRSDETVVVGSFDELEKLSGVRLTDPHKPFVDEVTWINPNSGGTFRRVKDVIDVWYDSGAMPFARFHYPFENKELFEKKFPANYIAEGIDQTRGWFYTLHVLGVALFGSKAFNNVLVNGMFLAADGTKMSKSKKNYTPAEENVAKFGADPIRAYALSTPIVRAEEVAFNDQNLADINSSFIIPVINSVKYLLIYTAQKDWTLNSYTNKSENILDKWIIAKLKQVTSLTNTAMEKYDLQNAMRESMKFIDDLSNWYIRRSRERFVAGNKFALSTLYSVLKDYSRLIAPFTPFLAERVYLSLTESVEDKDAKESVHLEDALMTEPDDLDIKLIQNMDNLRLASSLGLKIRDDNKLKLRQPLATLQVAGVSKEMIDLLKEELNTKTVEYVEDGNFNTSFVHEEDRGVKVALDLNLTDELLAEGFVNDFVRIVQTLRKELKCKIGQSIKLSVHSNSKVSEMIKEYEKDILSRTSSLSIYYSKTPLNKKYTIGENAVYIEVVI